jgi:hypothetical protein
MINPEDIWPPNAKYIIDSDGNETIIVDIPVGAEFINIYYTTPKEDYDE